MAPSDFRFEPPSTRSSYVVDSSVCVRSNRFTASANRRNVSMLAMTIRASRVRSSIPITETLTKASITKPLSRIRSTTSTRLLPRYWYRVCWSAASAMAIDPLLSSGPVDASLLPLPGDGSTSGAEITGSGRGDDPSDRVGHSTVGDTGGRDGGASGLAAAGTGAGVDHGDQLLRRRPDRGAPSARGDGAGGA